MPGRQVRDLGAGLPLPSAAPDSAVERAVAEFAINGVAHLDGIIPPAALAEMRAVWPAVRDNFDVRYGPEHLPATADGSYSGKGPRRHQISPLPLAPPFLAAAGEPLACWVEHPAVLAFLEGVLGPDFCCSGWGCNVPYPGSAFQRWHRDGLGPKPSPERWVAVQWVADDASSPDQGPLEYLPCTQHVPDFFAGYDGSAARRPLTAALDRLISEPGPESVSGSGAGALGAWGHEWGDGHKGPHRRDGKVGAGFSPAQMLMRPGQVWFRDNLVYHRGTPVTSSAPRDVFHFCEPATTVCQILFPVPFLTGLRLIVRLSADFHTAAETPVSAVHRKVQGQAAQFIPDSVWAQLSPRARHMFRPFRVADVEEVAAEQAAAQAWPEEDALWLAKL